jgi:endo-1,4-beta-xylanase
VTGVLVALIAAGGIGLYRLGLLAPAGAPVAPQPGPAAPATLRASAAARNFLIGAAIAAPQLREDAIYSQKISQEFNIVVPENAMKFGPLRPSRAEFKFDDADSIVEFAFNNGMKVRGQPLIWDGQLARWLMDGKFSAVEVSAILKDHIQTLVTRYRGRVYSWDVTNDALDGLGRVRGTIWSKALGEDYLQQVFLWAREADPAVKLFLNNNDNFLLLETADAFYNAVKNLKARGIPIDGIGLHSHWEVDKAPKMSAVAANMKQFAALGLEIHVTELDLRMSLPPTEQNLQRQAAVYREYLTACLSIPNCKAFLTWGFTDKYSWIPRFFPGFGSALPFDTDYKPKPAYAAMLDALNAR